MFKLFSLAFAVFSLIVAVQCGIPACPTHTGGPKPSSHTARGSICVFKCPESNVEGNNLSSSIHDSARLNCRYTASNTTGIQAACVYNKYTGQLLNNGGNTKCPESALFYCPRTGLVNDNKRNSISNRSPVPKYFQARTKLGRSNKAKRGEL
ncbi:hypothetical protein BDM02DRAFT_3266073 [Thelephora ganbajun]|uniref:Uncharacterized protein n=1 Tax=Thelephora ganbajun TaxID=370292 RepID=A0ACB6ZTF3_THEGA|nr:hypothetical protein BDM02DRAFT_3266073 [Thelephora ganbajun]